MCDKYNVCQKCIKCGIVNIENLVDEFFEEEKLLLIKDDHKQVSLSKFLVNLNDNLMNIIRLNNENIKSILLLNEDKMLSSLNILQYLFVLVKFSYLRIAYWLKQLIIDDVKCDSIDLLLKDYFRSIVGKFVEELERNYDFDRKFLEFVKKLLIVYYNERVDSKVLELDYYDLLNFLGGVFYLILDVVSYALVSYFSVIYFGKIFVSNSINGFLDDYLSFFLDNFEVKQIRIVDKELTGYVELKLNEKGLYDKIIFV